MCEIVCEVNAILDCGIQMNEVTYFSESDAPIMLVEDEILSKLNDLLKGESTNSHFKSLRREQNVQST